MKDLGFPGCIVSSADSLADEVGCCGSAKSLADEVGCCGSGWSSCCGSSWGCVSGTWLNFCCSIVGVLLVGVVPFFSRFSFGGGGCVEVMVKIRYCLFDFLVGCVG